MAQRERWMSRRAFGGLALGSAGALIANHRSVAQTSLSPTAAGPLGPFFPAEIPADTDADLTIVDGASARASGHVIQVHGRVLDRHGNPIEGARLRIWQANAVGRYDHPGDISTQPLDPNFQSYADLRTSTDGAWRITTIKPGGYDSPIGHRTPHIHGRIAGPQGELTTQMYFSDEAELNAQDSLFRDLGARAPTAIAEADAEQPDIYRWNIVLDEG